MLKLTGISLVCVSVLLSVFMPPEEVSKLLLGENHVVVEEQHPGTKDLDSVLQEVHASEERMRELQRETKENQDKLTMLSQEIAKLNVEYEVPSFTNQTEQEETSTSLIFIRLALLLFCGFVVYNILKKYQTLQKKPTTLQTLDDSKIEEDTEKEIEIKHVEKKRDYLQEDDEDATFTEEIIEVPDTKENVLLMPIEDSEFDESEDETPNPLANSFIEISSQDHVNPTTK
eukprot:TRINITY_DN15_c0_g2_i1.p1 TRINITY_DN15_c0_g2~~TRINITY_DN15_c0_g2_i1.p1  ORF type:complete len:230 (+),score=68.14 TRINITY_DN15_c0_g2_i1:98-787(+)